jgi:hypothetical protein
MASQGLTGFGTVNTLATGDTEYCTHNGESAASSWADLGQLAALGWKFGPHEYDSPAKVATLTPAQQWQVTCGQAQALASHGLGSGNGMISYPGLQQGSSAVKALQQSYGQNCFAWGRTYNKAGITSQSAASVAPYWQTTMALKGGPGKGSPAYMDPATVIAEMQSLQPGQWMTIQVYLLVTGTSPAGDAIAWDCASATHTSGDVERYCYSDFQQVAQAAAQLQQAGQITVTDPLTVGAAFGRPSTYQMDRP